MGTRPAGHVQVTNTIMVILFMVLAFIPTLMAIHYENNCETLPSKIHITKEEYGPTKELVRTCEEDVELAKCEGSCVSSTQPSAMERSGFLKDCKCCRESGYRERTLTLHNCYNGDGHKLEGGLGTMQVTIKVNNLNRNKRNLKNRINLDQIMFTL